MQTIERTQSGGPDPRLPNGIDRLHLLGDHWVESSRDLTPLGRLVGRAKDHGHSESVTALCEMIGEASEIWLADMGGSVVVAVPPNPLVDDHLAPRLAEAVAVALGLSSAPDLLTRSKPTVRLRDTPPDARPALAHSAGYQVGTPLNGADVVLVDDVIMTGTTLSHVASLLSGAGAGRVIAVVASRTRRIDD